MSINKSLLKNFIIILFFAILISACGKNEKTTTNTYEKVIPKGSAFNVNIKESSINWLAKKVTGSHTGMVNISSGELIIDNGKLTGGKFDIDFKTITVLELDDAEMNKKLTDHLKSDDFFSAEKYPIGRLEITSVTETPNSSTGNNYDIKGNLTIKGITKEISFPAKMNFDNKKASAEASIELDRTEWDIKFRSGRFFENLGDKLIFDKFNLTVKLSANSE